MGNQDALDPRDFLNRKDKLGQCASVFIALKIVIHFLIQVTVSSNYPIQQASWVPAHNFNGKLFFKQFLLTLKSHFLPRNPRGWDPLTGLKFF
jgi:hypothetical protein